MNDKKIKTNSYIFYQQAKKIKIIEIYDYVHPKSEEFESITK
jgi:hypothetical protein